MNDLPREARWSLIAAVVLGLFLAGLGAGAVLGSRGLSWANGSVTFKGGQGDGLEANTSSARAAGVRSVNTETGGVAIWGTNSGSGIGVYGVASGSEGSQGPSAGVAGQGNTSDSVGVYGLNEQGGQAGYFVGAVTVTHTLDAQGGVVGSSAVLSLNASQVRMKSGDAVAILGAQHGWNGSYLLLVGPAAKGRAVVGVVAYAVVASTIDVSAASQNGNGDWQPNSLNANVLVNTGGSVGPGSDLVVLTAGVSDAANVSAASGPVAVGEPLVVGDTPGQLVAAGTSPTAGTVVGYALSSLSKGTALIPVLVQPR